MDDPANEEKRWDTLASVNDYNASRVDRKSLTVSVRSISSKIYVVIAPTFVRNRIR